MLSIAKHSSKFQHISVLITSTYMTTSGMHRRPFEGRHLVVKNFQTPNLNIHYASPPSGDAYCDRHLTTRFELQVEIFVRRHVSI